MVISALYPDLKAEVWEGQGDALESCPLGKLFVPSELRHKVFEKHHCFETKDDIYCYSLAKALHYAVSPLTVGFYAPWGRREDFLINKVESYLCLEGLKKDGLEEERTGLRIRKRTGKDLIKLIFLMTFYHPVITETHKQRTNIHYCFIRFSAWEFAGSDQLWAGLVTTLCDGIENCFGLAPISIYRAVSTKTKIIDAPLKQEWVSKKFLCLPLWVAILLAIFIAVAVGASILIFGFPLGDLSGNMLAAVQGVGSSVVGISLIIALKVGIKVVKNVIVTQKGIVQQKMNRTDMSSQLGFMSDVRKEVKTITSYLQLMEVFQRQKIRVVLEITNLDKCMPDKVVGVLNAMNILLSDANAPFISILSVDPSIIVECVESSDLLKGMANNGYEFLNRIITLPFCIPKMDCDTKLSLLRSIIEGTDEVIRDKEQGQKKTNTGVNTVDMPTAVKGSYELEPNSSFLDKGPSAKNLIDEALGYFFQEHMREYITDNAVHIKRMVNTITITIRLMIREVPRSQIQPRKVTEWVLLATHWPCRLSWILQCIEDEQQNMSLEGQQTDSSYSRTFLWDVFEKTLEELNAIKTSLKQLLELDGDPQIFHHLLRDNFTVEDANFFLPFTVNLDTSIKRQMELLRGSNNMWESKKSNRLTVKSLLNMSVDEVCEEMNKLGFREENVQMYKQKIKDHNLSGKALVYSDINEIKNVMEMGLGDWTLFSVYFFGALPSAPTAPATAPVIGKQEAP
ncbi:NTPase KAP family P-loop domain-containing protein 1-like [Bufo bufo]|uniref:NTPase KAP family P-loop domain-containing protein 1-like n=1 Tax=Bufo bufo TaxID=8384 RepID=UPI001ABE0103|nr:NTPase KAP family P-loop domain-containing protein 1-like [Bufo bufo]